MKMNIIWCLLSILLFSGCDHQDLCYHHQHGLKVRVIFNWKYAPDARPRGMCVFFYSEENHSQYYRFDFTGRDGGYVELPEGNYRVIAYNNDSQVTEFMDYTYFDSHKAITRKGNVLESVLGPLAHEPVNGQNVYVSPDCLWSAVAKEVMVDNSGVSYTCVPYDPSMDSAPEQSIVTTEMEIELYPEDVLCHYTWEVLDINGLERIEKVAGSISGMAHSLYLGTNDLASQPVTIPLPSRITPDGRIEGEFLTFGHNELISSPHKIELYAWMKSGKKFVFGREQENFDVTRQIHSAPDKRHVHLIIRGLEIPKDGGDIAPSFDDWVCEDHELPI